MYNVSCNTDSFLLENVMYQPHVLHCLYSWIFHHRKQRNVTRRFGRKTNSLFSYSPTARNKTSSNYAPLVAQQCRRANTDEIAHIVDQTHRESQQHGISDKKLDFFVVADMKNL